MQYANNGTFRKAMLFNVDISKLLLEDAGYIPSLEKSK